MPARKDYTPEFKDQAVRFVLEEIEPDESRKRACDRLAPKLSVKAVTLYNWVKQSAPAKARPSAPPGSPHPPRSKAREVETKNAGDAGTPTDSGQLADSRKRKRFQHSAANTGNNVLCESFSLSQRVLCGRRMKAAGADIGDDADDGIAAAVERDLTADHGGARAETPAPQPAADDRARYQHSRIRASRRSG